MFHPLSEVIDDVGAGVIQLCGLEMQHYDAMGFLDEIVVLALEGEAAYEGEYSLRSLMNLFFGGLAAWMKRCT